MINKEPKFYVKRIIDLRHNWRRKRHEYLVKWTRYDDPTWELVIEYADSAAAEEYYRNHPDMEDLNELAKTQPE